MSKSFKKLATVLTVILVATVFTFVLTACRNDETKYKVGVFVYKYDDNYITSVRNELTKNFKQYENQLEVTFYNGEGNQATQTAQIDSAITAGIDLLIINAVDQKASGENLAKKVKDAGKSAIFFNREVNDATIKTSDKFCFVGTDPNAPGYMLGEMIANMVKTQELYNKYDLNKDGKLDYVMIRADVGNPEADGRTKYSVEESNRLIANNTALKEGSGLKQIGSDENAQWDTTIAQQKMAAFLASNPMTGTNPVELVICNNDGMAMGAIAALNAVGYNNNGSKTAVDGKYIPVYGVDAIADAVDAIKNGKMEGTVKQDANAMAKAIVDIAMNVKNGKGFLEGTNYKFDEGVNKLRIPYEKYSGQPA